MAIFEIERLNGTAVTVDTEKRSVERFRYKVKFTPNEWKLLVMLYKANGEMVKRDELIAHIWNGEIHSTRTVDMHLSAVRKKLAYIKGATIKSCYGKGYKFVMLEKF